MKRLLLLLSTLLVIGGCRDAATQPLAPAKPVAISGVYDLRLFLGVAVPDPFPGLQNLGRDGYTGGICVGVGASDSLVMVLNQQLRMADGVDSVIASSSLTSNICHGYTEMTRVDSTRVSVTYGVLVHGDTLFLSPRIPGATRALPPESVAYGSRVDTLRLAGDTLVSVHRATVAPRIVYVRR